MMLHGNSNQHYRSIAVAAAAATQRKSDGSTEVIMKSTKAKPVTTSASILNRDLTVGLLLFSVVTVSFIFTSRSVTIMSEQRYMTVVGEDVDTWYSTEAPVMSEQPHSRRTKSANKINTVDKPQRRIPSILLAGAQKASTTSVAKYLMDDPHICFSKDGQVHEDDGKESHFFDGPLFERGLSGLQDLYQNCSDDSILIDGTPATMTVPERVKAIYDEHGTAHDVKIIFILREPVARELSWYKHKARYVSLPVAKRPEWAADVFETDANGTLKSFIQVQRETVLNYLDIQMYSSVRGYYSYWLERWSSLFDRQSQILILSYEELQRDPATLLQRVHDFLGLPVTRPLALRHENSDVVKKAAPSCQDQDEFAAAFDKLNEELYQYMDNNPGPSMEQFPFPKFDRSCKDKKQ